jgi:hypothetical protein
MKAVLAAFAIFAVLGLRQAYGQMFSPEERKAILSFWSEAGRYRVSLPESAAKAGPWQVRLTPEGSTWLWSVANARGGAKTPPTETPKPANAEEAQWEAWIDAKVERDRWEASRNAAALNASVTGVAARRDPLTDAEPAHPGPVPMGLVALSGNPPPMACAVIPMQHEVRFPDATVRLIDNPNVRPRYAYYRFPQGVMVAGRKVRELPSAELEELFRDAGVEAAERRVMTAVSMLEGGFESVNTYDTGFVSVGFIQFACLSTGSGSLGRLLLKHKTSSKDAFERDFRRFGLDVTAETALVAIDPSTGAELVGAEAAKKIVDDKRLIAAFQRAGEKSRAFRVAQIQLAKEQYFPASDEVRITVGSREIAGKVSDFARSEATLAILMDRKVNTGKLDGLAEVLAYCAEQCGAKSLKDLAKYERDVATMMRYRTDYLADGTLSQPGPSLLAKRDYDAIASRRAARGSRKPPK